MPYTLGTSFGLLWGTYYLWKYLCLPWDNSSFQAKALACSMGIPRYECRWICPGILDQQSKWDHDTTTRQCPSTLKWKNSIFSYRNWAFGQVSIDEIYFIFLKGNRHSLLLTKFYIAKVKRETFPGISYCKSIYTISMFPTVVTRRPWDQALTDWFLRAQLVILGPY